jgi:hypothetical protein
MKQWIYPILLVVVLPLIMTVIVSRAAYKLYHRTGLPPRT